MASSKKDKFNPKRNEIAEIAKALSHPARIAILEFLITKDVCVCGEIVNRLPLSQATVSQHLKELKKIGLITGVAEGAKTCYFINKQKLNLIKNQFAIFFNINLSKSGLANRETSYIF